MDVFERVRTAIKPESLSGHIKINEQNIISLTPTEQESRDLIAKAHAEQGLPVPGRKDA